jgi:biopolymer transport protein ExbB
MSPVEIWSQMGIAARVILWVLAGLACLAGYVVVERVLALSRVAGSPAVASRVWLQRRTHALAAVKVTAPMLGVLGTLIGLINALAGVALTNRLDLRAASAAVAEALVMTVLGLLVGLPAWWADGALQAWQERILAARGD